MPEGHSTFSPERIKALTDGVIAIVITLLVLELSVPVVSEIPGSEGLWPELRGEWRGYVAYLMSFFLVGLLWLYHHTVFRHIRAADGRLLFLNMLFLLAVSVTPFTSALVANNWTERLAAIVYGSSLFLAVAANAATFSYASWRRRLLDGDLPASFVRRENLSALGLLTLLAGGTLLGFINSVWTYAVLGSIIVFYWTTALLNREGVSVHRRSTTTPS